MNSVTTNWQLMNIRAEIGDQIRSIHCQYLAVGCLAKTEPSTLQYIRRCSKFSIQKSQLHVQRKLYILTIPVSNYNSCVGVSLTENLPWRPFYTSDTHILSPRACWRDSHSFPLHYSLFHNSCRCKRIFLDVHERDTRDPLYFCMFYHSICKFQYHLLFARECQMMPQICGIPFSGKKPTSYCSKDDNEMWI